MDITDAAKRKARAMLYEDGVFVGEEKAQEIVAAFIEYVSDMAQQVYDLADPFIVRWSPEPFQERKRGLKIVQSDD